MKVGFNYESCRVKNRISDGQLLDLVQRETLKYFWWGGHPVSGMAYERSDRVKEEDRDKTAVGGTGFGIMAMVAGVERGFQRRFETVERLLKMTDFLENKAIRYDGVFPHWMNGETGETLAFDEKDKRGDIVETAFLMMGLLTAREYFNADKPDEIELRRRINNLWKDVQWVAHCRGTDDRLFWHGNSVSEDVHHLPIGGWNECLIAYVLAASSPTYPIGAKVYHECFKGTATFKNNEDYYGITLPLGPEAGGPMFLAHYSFLGLDPRGLTEGGVDFFEQNRSHALINRAHCIVNPGGYKGYGRECWGLTASYSVMRDMNQVARGGEDIFKAKKPLEQGYCAHSPVEDRGVIAPTAALGSFPYTPDYAMEALRFFYERLGDKVWGRRGFADAFSIHHGWVADGQIAIDQGPIVAMIENYRSGLLWDLFMNAPEVKNGLSKLGFQSRRHLITPLAPEIVRAPG
jgi:hypothetical protein